MCVCVCLCACACVRACERVCVLYIYAVTITASSLLFIHFNLPLDFSCFFNSFPCEGHLPKVSLHFMAAVYFCYRPLLTVPAHTDMSN